MNILEFGDPQAKKLVLIHGFQCPYVVLNKYIDYYKKDFHIIVPVLPGHDGKREEFVSVADTVKEFEDFYIRKYGNEIYAVYAMSMGGIFACELWRNQNIVIERLIMESSPLLSFRKQVINYMIRWYLKMAGKIKAGNGRALEKVERSFIVPEYISDFKAVINNMSESSIRNYISEIGQFKFSGEELASLYSCRGGAVEGDADNDSAGEKSENVCSENHVKTKLVYFYGGKVAEMPFKRVGHFIKKNYKSAKVIKLKDKGHCEDSLLHADQWIFTLNQLL